MYELEKDRRRGETLIRHDYNSLLFIRIQQHLSYNQDNRRYTQGPSQDTPGPYIFELYFLLEYLAFNKPVISKNFNYLSISLARSETSLVRKTGKTNSRNWNTPNH